MPMMARTCGVISAPAAPCSTRAPIRSPALGASPQAAEVSVNRARPVMNIRRRPYKWPSRPPVIIPVANVSPYPAMISCTAARLACSPDWMDGRPR